MQTLREIRESLGISQTEVANKSNITSPDLSRYESGQLPPDVEDMVILERIFSQKINWSPNEKIEEQARGNIIDCFNALTNHYPLISVLRFLERSIREGQKFGKPDKFILHFTSLSQEIKPLLPNL